MSIPTNAIVTMEEVVEHLYNKECQGKIVINDEIERAANYDAAMAEITGYNSSQQLKAAASQHKNNANAAAATGVLDTVSTGASGYSKAKAAKKAADQAAINTAAPPKTTGGWQ